jgi:UDP-glucose 4-epimerase
MSQIHIIFGGLGFIGVNLIRNLEKTSKKIYVVDKNIWNTSLLWIDECECEIEIYKEDITNFLSLNPSFVKELNEEICVWHLAANSDIRAGISDIWVDTRDTFLTTISILNWMKINSFTNLRFASSSAVYGSTKQPFSENSALEPISNYGAMKAASELVIKSSVDQFLTSALVYRFPNVIGIPATHGVILDFINKLKATPEKLQVLGNGQQSKPYLHVSTLVEAMVYLSNLSNTASYDVFNIGEKDSNVSVTEIAEMVRKLVNPNASIIYGTESYGWLGDMPKVEFNLDKLKTAKWSSKMNGKNAVLRTINEILENHND